ncbi:isoprenoid synthase domain-containing protein [Cadophora sp. MPI-SDFR-AT-0126]|nr:isoprenoid synthase domain-containing protein [Leotiomycetes sp. MPI-SDFR-AT-0126]
MEIIDAANILEEGGGIQQDLAENRINIGVTQSAIISFLFDVPAPRQRNPRMGSPTTSTNTFRIPDLLESWPFERRLNPATDAVKTQNEAWTRSLKLNHGQLERALQKAPITLIAALTCPLVPATSFQTAADAMTTFLIFDEISDQLSESVVAGLYEVIEDVFEHPDKSRPIGECFIGSLHRSFWNRARQGATPTFVKHFPTRYLEYAKSTSEQAMHRDESRIPDLTSYMALRWKTVGGMPSFGVTLHSLNISDDELSDPKVRRLESLAQDMLIMANDICSYNVEQSRGDSHNAIAVVMHHNNLSLQNAIDLIAQMFHKSEEEFLTVMETVESMNDDLCTYVSGLGCWVRGNFEMSFEIERYGLDGEARRGGLIKLLPKQTSN